MTPLNHKVKFYDAKKTPSSLLVKNTIRYRVDNDILKNSIVWCSIFDTDELS